MKINFLKNPTKFLLFTGKGGVGKTSLSCSTAIHLSEIGKRVLLVSTDPASNLDEVLNTKLSSIPTPVPFVSGLFALNINPVEAAFHYREKVVKPYRGVLPDAAIKSIEEQLSGACTVEIAAFDEFSKLLGDPVFTTEYDHIVFDTAPTGHTLRLLELPAAWSGFLESNVGGSSCLGPLAGLDGQRTLYSASLKALSDSVQTTMILVCRPEETSIKEAERTHKELSTIGIQNQELLINGVFHANNHNDPIAKALELKGQKAAKSLPEGIRTLPVYEIPLLPYGLVGIEKLRTMFKNKKPIVISNQSNLENEGVTAQNMHELIDVIAKQGHGLIMTMGKGGVGKTTIASMIAVNLAKRGHHVHLSTTDPAAHLDGRLENIVEGLEISCIDPKIETEKYTREVLANVGNNLTEQGKKLLEEDLRSPCTEEIAVFRAFAHIVDSAEKGFVVLDTAPTGHSILLLDATETYHKQVSHTMSDLPDAVRNLLPRLRDGEFTKVVIVTLPEATPVHEAAQLQNDLKRAGIEPFAWVINQSFSAHSLTDPTLVQRKNNEKEFIQEVKAKYAIRLSVVPWMSYSPEQVDWFNSM